MISLLLVVMMATVPAVKQHACSPVAKPVSISWSERSEFRSPNCKWIIAVNPGSTGGDGPADLVLKSAESGASHLIAKVNRDAIIHWSRDGNAFLLEDMAYSDHYRLLLFDPLSESSSESEATSLDKLIRKKVEDSLGTNEQINYYLPRYVAWSTAGLVVSIGVVTVHGSSGPFTPHCYGFTVGTKPLTIRASLSSTELKKKYKTSCQIWP
jgi:hypothetical protein